MPTKRRRKKPLVVIVIDIVEVPLVFLFTGVWGFIWAWILKPDSVIFELLVIFELPVWAKWLALVFWLLGGGCLFFFLKWLKEENLE